jgi:hypothetical protein
MSLPDPEATYNSKPTEGISSMKKMILILTLLLSATAYAGQAVPFHAAINTQIQVLSPCGDNCLLLNITGTGQGLHFGRLSVEGPSEIHFDTTMQTGCSTLTAADGSRLDISVEGTFLPGPTITFEGDWAVISGTGRFAHASGGGTYHGFASGDAGVLYMQGTLSNGGADSN